LKKECYEISLSDGTKIRASFDHRFLIKNAWETYKWITTEEIYKKFRVGKHNGNRWFRRGLPVWEDINEYDIGYLAGMFDGEGCLHQHGHKKDKRWGKWSCSLAITQSLNNIFERTKRLLEKYNFKYSVFIDKKKNVGRILIRGGIGEYLRFLGTVKPEKLSKLEIEKLGSIKIYDDKREKTKIISIKPIGKQTVYGLGTTSKTYIAEGFFCHNTNRRHDLPFIRTRCLKWGIEFPLYKELFVNDCYDIVKAKLRLHRNRMENACEFLKIPSKKHRLDAEMWQKAKLGDKKALIYVWEHNKEDVLSLKSLYEKLREFGASRQTSI
jgi:hypothetical protein